MNFLIFGIMVDIGLKFYSEKFPPWGVTSETEFSYKSQTFCIKVYITILSRSFD